MNDKPEPVALDISGQDFHHVIYLCPNCSSIMLATRIEDHTEYKCPLCGTEKNPMVDTMKHASILTPAMTEDQISSGEDLNVFEVLSDESGLESVEREPDNPILEEDKKQDEAWRRKGYKVSTID